MNWMNEWNEWNDKMNANAWNEWSIYSLFPFQDFDKLTTYILIGLGVGVSVFVPSISIEPFRAAAVKNLLAEPNQTDESAQSASHHEETLDKIFSSLWLSIVW